MDAEQRGRQRVLKNLAALDNSMELTGAFVQIRDVEIVALAKAILELQLRLEPVEPLTQHQRDFIDGTLDRRQDNA